jgi:hypothetical protein
VDPSVVKAVDWVDAAGAETIPAPSLRQSRGYRTTIVPVNWWIVHK